MKKPWPSTTQLLYLHKTTSTSAPYVKRFTHCTRNHSGKWVVPWVPEGTKLGFATRMGWWPGLPALTFSAVVLPTADPRVPNGSFSELPACLQLPAVLPAEMHGQHLSCSSPAAPEGPLSLHHVPCIWQKDGWLFFNNRLLLDERLLHHKPSKALRQSYALLLHKDFIEITIPKISYISNSCTSKF